MTTNHLLTLTECNCTIIHANTVESVRKQMPSANEIFELSEFFKILGDSTRIRILSALSQSELCVCDISSLLEMTQSAVSHQLRLLKQARLVKFRRCGKIVYYSLDDTHVRDVLSVGFAHTQEKIIQ